MKALVVDQDYSISVREVADPKINNYMAKVKMLGCGICGSEHKILTGTGVFKGTPGITYPLVAGHEGVGEVIEVGSEVTTYKVGDIVLSPYNRAFEEGYCAAWGAFAEYGTVFDPYAPGAEALGPAFLYTGRKQNVLPDFIDPLEAIMIITLRETAGAVRHFKIEANQAVVVFGLGPVGLSFVQFMNFRGAKPIIAVDVIQEKLDLALELGADYAFDASDPDLTAKIRAIIPRGADHVIDAVGKVELYNAAMPLLGPTGQICAYGVPKKDEVFLDWNNNPNYNFNLNYYQMSDAANECWAHNQIVTLIKKGIIKLSDYISDYVSFSDILPTLDRFLNNEYLKKVIVKF